VSIKSLIKSHKRVDKIIDNNIDMINNTKNRASEIPHIDTDKYPDLFKKKRFL
jgi:hypothetical protein